MTAMKELNKKFGKAYGTTIGGIGYTPAQIERCPTGVFEFDLATGGGFPKNKLSIVYGPESSGKTLIVLKAIAYMQATKPHLTCVYFDFENTFDPVWARALGIDVDKLAVYRPDYAEQAVDMIEALLRADDVGIVAVDSVAAMVTTRELNQSAEKDNVGGSTMAVGKMVRKGVLAMSDSEKAGGSGTLILINQLRVKVGVMYGNPETFPGGNAQRFASCMTVRLYGKNIVDAKSNVKSKPVRKHHSVVLQKWKVPILSTHVEWDTAVVPHVTSEAKFKMSDPLETVPVGHTWGWNDAEKVLRGANLLVQTKEGWAFDGATLPTLSAWKEFFDKTPVFRSSIVEIVMASEGVELQTEGETILEDDSEIAMTPVEPTDES